MAKFVVAGEAGPGTRAGQPRRRRRHLVLGPGTRARQPRRQWNLIPGSGSWDLAGQPRRRQHLVPGAGRGSSPCLRQSPLSAGSPPCPSLRLSGSRVRTARSLRRSRVSVPPHPVGEASAYLLLSPQEWPPRPLGGWLGRLFHLQDYPSLAGSH